ncbi:spindle and kinetochore-associated protein 1-like [Osmia bicornis bicornis]|uniref:spindle and kinetochore-associated protein 1-like n=1 Tax=Osmia bicornis bicornis TaxID=1437191 RepID=UPI0010F502D6|nr:spindle and kinetochore-associated protein 1-like [Osmia bicornis bicornis]
MATSCSLEKILEQQCEKLKVLEIATIFINSKKEIKEELFEMYKQVEDMHRDNEMMKNRLNKIKEQSNRCVELSLFLKELDKKIIHMEKNISSELIDDYHHSENSLCMSILSEDELLKQALIITDTDSEEQMTPLKDCKKILFNEPEVCPIIPAIREDEFKTIPKYLIGRQPIEIVNNLIDTINQVLKAKYTFLTQGKAHARKQGTMSLYLHYKKQELDVCTNKEYVYFFTASDYEKYANSKLNKTKLNLLTVLRHCKRLRQYTVKSDILYVIQTK